MLAPSLWRVKVSWLLFGIAVGGIYSYYKLQDDVWQSARSVETVVQTLHPELKSLDKAINSKIQALEARVKALEK